MTEQGVLDNTQSLISSVDSEDIEADVFNLTKQFIVDNKTFGKQQVSSSMPPRITNINIHNKNSSAKRYLNQRSQPCYDSSGGGASGAAVGGGGSASGGGILLFKGSNSAHHNNKNGNPVKNGAHQPPNYDALFAFKGKVPLASALVIYFIVGSVIMTMLVTLTTIYLTIGPNTSHKQNGDIRDIILPLFTYIVNTTVSALFYMEARNLQMSGYSMLFQNSSTISKINFRVVSVYYTLAYAVFAFLEHHGYLSDDSLSYVFLAVWFFVYLFIIGCFMRFWYIFRTHNKFKPHPTLFKYHGIDSPSSHLNLHYRQRSNNIMGNRDTNTGAASNTDGHSGTGTGDPVTVQSVMIGDQREVIKRLFHDKKTLKRQLHNISQKLTRTKEQFTLLQMQFNCLQNHNGAVGGAGGLGLGLGIGIGLGGNRSKNGGASMSNSSVNSLELNNNNNPQHANDSGHHHGHANNSHSHQMSGGGGGGQIDINTYANLRQMQEKMVKEYGLQFQKKDERIRTEQTTVRTLKSEIKTRQTMLEAKSGECLQQKQLIANLEQRIKNINKEKDSLERLLNQASDQKDDLLVLYQVKAEEVKIAQEENRRLRNQLQKLTQSISANNAHSYASSSGLQQVEVSTSKASSSNI